ncbi:hypothetical protein GGH97_003824, partial [Coemansia sp. RSA 475]
LAADQASSYSEPGQALILGYGQLPPGYGYEQLPPQYEHGQLSSWYEHGRDDGSAGHADHEPV